MRKTPEIALGQGRRFRRVREGGIHVLDEIQFKPGTAQMLAGVRGYLNDWAGELRHESKLHLTIVAHTDSKHLGNQSGKISVKRAKAVKKYLTKMKVDPNQIEVLALGHTVPRATNKNIRGRALNNRIEFILS